MIKNSYLNRLLYICYVKKLTLTFLIILSANLYSQKKYTKEFSFVNDNDLYVSTHFDRYYTNGMFFTYRYLSENHSKKTVKKIYELSIGQEMYTPFKAVVQSVSLHDRPFAGHLFGSFSIAKFKQNSSFTKTTFQAGILGKNAFARELMEIIHNIYGFEEAVGWDYQIKDAISLGINFNYTKNLNVNNDYFDINWSNSARLGTVYTDVSTGFISRIGLKPLENFANTIAFNSNLNNENSSFNNEIESFFYIKPTLKLVGYDATIEGSFLNTKSPVTYNINPLQFFLELGFKFTANKFNFGYAFVYHTKKLKSIRVPKSSIYGSIQINYQFN
ncbi:lipid A deacylase LpxR family protein [Tenacibaculum geojense]|uniref:Lipid A deacylase LpxR family protein n=1 Tax=Tenacibaculum geojense TaxID=915352 RepID=A0ABW3JQS5_9FLAO